MDAGITALCQLESGPLPHAACQALGFASAPGSFIGATYDPAGSAFADRLADQTRVTLVLGQPQGLERDALRSGLAAGMRLLFDRYGEELSARIEGEWALVDWRPGRLTLIQSRTRRDWLFIARHGNLVALSGDLEQLAALDWVGRELDPLGLAGAFGRSALRAGLARQTVLPGVERLAPGECLILEPGSDRRNRAALPAVTPWHGSFAEAIEEARTVLNRIVSERLAQARAPAVMLSGGLDSSTLAAVIKDVAGPGTRLTALTSVAPDGSDLPDERVEAAAVAEWLGIDQVLVTPDPTESLYRPAPEIYRLAGGPTLSPRHYLYRTLCGTARERGFDTLFDGAYGELSLTSYLPVLTPRYRLRQMLKRLLRGDADAPASPFHIRLAGHRLAKLAPRIDELVAENRRPLAQRAPHERLGWVPGYDKAWESPTLLDHGIRNAMPFRDPRLLQLFAAFPASFLVRDGLNRAPARAMMAGHLPEAIRLRRTAGPFSPDYMKRIGDHAPLALARFAAFRRAEADDWIDLGWLEQALQRISANGPSSIDDAFEVQLTAMAAEFLVWWRRAG